MLEFILFIIIIIQTLRVGHYKKMSNAYKRTVRQMADGLKDTVK